MALTVLIGFAGVFGASEGIRASQAKSKREEHRSRKNNLIVHCPKSSEFSPRLEGRQVVLSGDKLYIDTGTAFDVPFGHPFAGYYLAYPEAKYAGLVSTITDEAPIMNWIYVDLNTYELKFGTRQFAEPHLTGPFDCTRQDRRLTCGGWEGFVAVQEGDFWSIYFDLAGDNLKSKVAPGTPVIELELLRRELRVRKPPPPPPPEQNPEQDQQTTAQTEGAPVGATAAAAEGALDGAQGSVGQSAAPATVETADNSGRVSPGPPPSEASVGSKGSQGTRASDTTTRGRRGRRPKSGQQQQQQQQHHQQQKPQQQKQQQQQQKQQQKEQQKKQQKAQHQQRPQESAGGEKAPMSPTPRDTKKHHMKVEIVADVEDGRILPESPELD